MVVLTLHTPQGTLDLLLRIVGHDWESEELSKPQQGDEMSRTDTATNPNMHTRPRAKMEAHLRDILQGERIACMHAHLRVNQSPDLLLNLPHSLLVAALIKAVSDNKPTLFEPFAVHWLGVNYKEDLSPEQSARTSHGGWTSRGGVFRTEQELTAYLLEIRLPMLMEVAVSAAALMNPHNIPSFLTDFFLQAEEEATKFEAKMRQRAAKLLSHGEADADARRQNEQVTGGTRLELNYDVDENGKLSIDFSVTASATLVGS
jgi:hypothetical protein